MEYNTRSEKISDSGSIPGNPDINLHMNTNLSTDNNKVPVGNVCRIEHQQAHRDFIQTTKPKWVMVDIIHARRFLRKGRDSSWFPDETNVVTTSTVSDEKLELWSWERERDVVKEFNPNAHIPTDYAVYGDDSFSKRFDAVKNCMQGTLWMNNEIGDEVEILPLIKGFTVEERDLCYWVIDEIDAKMGVFYGTQYWSRGGVPLDELKHDLSVIGDEVTVPVHIIGLLSENYLRKMPEWVVSGSGQKWRRVVRPRECTEDEMKQKFNDFESAVNDACLSK